ncbi:glycosyltransferase family 4 protein [Candidatus Falkowbacteria bacterium]|nr:glycosyltransferase family 4 protein [Candidatus Falkowbacteria bacterium]
MLIGIDASRANREHKSGTEWYSYYLIKRLAKLDSQNQYVLYTDKPLKGGLLDLPDNFRETVLKWPFNFFWTQGRLSLEMLIAKPDVLFIPAHALPLVHPQKSIVTIHDVGFERDRRMYNKQAMGPGSKQCRKVMNFFVKLFSRGKYNATSLDYLSWSTRYTLKRAKKIITPSDFSKQEIMEVCGTDGDKIKVVHNGYNSLLYKKINPVKYSEQFNGVNNENEIREVLEKYGITKPYILCIGRLEKKKNTPALIEAFAVMREKNRNREYKLVLVGDAGFGFDEVKYAIREFDLVEKVIMPGWVEERDMPYLYNGATAFVFPSLYEGFGIPLLQAMACEVPITASRAASIPEVVGDAALLFDPTDVAAMAEAMEKIIFDNELRESLIKKGKERAKNFSWEKCAKETLVEIVNL